VLQNNDKIELKFRSKSLMIHIHQFFILFIFFIASLLQTLVGTTSKNRPGINNMQIDNEKINKSNKSKI